jgi:hypothetical protein
LGPHRRPRHLRSRSPSSSPRAASAISPTTISPMRASRRRSPRPSSRARRSNPRTSSRRPPIFCGGASDAGFGLVVDLEHSHGNALTAVAKDYPGTDYVILRSDPAPTSPRSCSRSRKAPISPGRSRRWSRRTPRSRA